MYGRGLSVSAAPTGAIREDQGTACAARGALPEMVDCAWVRKPGVLVRLRCPAGSVALMQCAPQTLFSPEKRDGVNNRK